MRSATAPTPACHVSTMPWNRGGIGSWFTAAHSASATRETDRAAEHRQQEALEEELPLHLAGGRAERLADADLARPLANRDQHDVHHADAAERQRDDADDA